MAASARELGLTAAAVLAAVGAIALVRAPLWATERQVKERYDVYVLPPPDELKVLALGYDSAVADLIWSHVMVEQGLHTEARRRFDNLGKFYDALHALDPTWRRPYLFAETLFTFTAETPPLEDVLKAREVLERGVAARPLDGELWADLGYYTSFYAPPSFLEPDHPELAKAWRADGIRFLERAAELSGGKAEVGWSAITAASALWKKGETEATLRFLRRALAVTEDENLRAYIRAQLAALGASTDPAIERAFTARYQRFWPFFGKSRALLLGPPRDPARCAGAGHGAEPECAASWLEWAEREGGDPWLDER
ncbi:MAG: hypothetical protein HY908_31410 [Myxococcales bacterium]|nr:hypothetical protein [Myxococcales bacterium]